MPATLPSTQTWTLRFKNHRTTVLLHVDPLQKLESIREELLKAVQETHPHGNVNGVTIPRNPDEIRLARPIDRNDLSLGWQALDQLDEADVDSSMLTGKGKGKASVASTPAKKMSATNTPRGAGLVNGGIVAFKFRESGPGPRDLSEEDQMDEAILAEVTDEWDVVIPTIEETYGDDET